uniref:Mediator of RNA polymerase II transcription subunit 18 n=1 Tax=Rhabditophanes sp. KR3021 TaxID=114890 RepID=A0AC35TGR5_9BILA
MASIPSHQQKETKYNPLSDKSVFEDFSDQVRRAAYQKKEIILYGCIHKDSLQMLKQRLDGLCDPGEVPFSEHEMVAYFRPNGKEKSLTIRFRRKFPGVDSFMHMKYIGNPEIDNKCPCIVRSRIDSVSKSGEYMDFMRRLGLRVDFEYIANGFARTRGTIVVTVYQISKIIELGNYQQTNIKPFGDCHIIEMSIMMPYLNDHIASAKMLRDFADQFHPYVFMLCFRFYCICPQDNTKHPYISIDVAQISLI